MSHSHRALPLTPALSQCGERRSGCARCKASPLPIRIGLRRRSTAAPSGVARAVRSLAPGASPRKPALPHFHRTCDLACAFDLWFGFCGGWGAAYAHIGAGFWDAGHLGFRTDALPLGRTLGRCARGRQGAEGGGLRRRGRGYPHRGRGAQGAHGRGQRCGGASGQARAAHHPAPPPR